MLFNKKAKKTQLKIDNIPNHVGIIMDGNGRWAKKKGFPVSYGHKVGSDRIEDIIKVGINQKIPIITVYAFSTENWKRSTEEINYLFSLIETFFKVKMKLIMENEIKLNFPGHFDNVPEHIQRILNEAKDKTKDNNKLVLNIAFNYGSRDEIIRAVNKFIKSNPGQQIDSEIKFSKYLDQGSNSNVDLLIRTSGEQRLSNFLLWQVAYSEFIFTKTLWPDFNQEQFLRCLEEYQKRTRRFGGR